MSWNKFKARFWRQDFLVWQLVFATIMLAYIYNMSVPAFLGYEEFIRQMVRDYNPVIWVSTWGMFISILLMVIASFKQVNITKVAKANRVAVIE